ncbi:hypothetical protein V2S66_24395 [Streptomyces sp. V4-01]|uniref:Uncharacterized protein n=1 Tax=Actinacidiphila polyblastidii TaxID=3110430 RepID=A0ABU7PH43_9ACTN|nr:hypothetical protein [Streptomyces sp. V4-01]
MITNTRLRLRAAVAVRAAATSAVLISPTAASAATPAGPDRAAEQTLTLPVRDPSRSRPSRPRTAPDTAAPRSSTGPIPTAMRLP